LGGVRPTSGPLTLLTQGRQAARGAHACRLDRHITELEELDVEGILAFAERILPRASDLWVQASLDQRQRFQQLFEPKMKVWWT
jgi:hypothetical protein